MKIIKRNGSEVAFDITKIIVAITKANELRGGSGSHDPRCRSSASPSL